MFTALQRFVPQRDAKPPVGLASAIDFDALFDAVTPDRVRRDHRHIVQAPSRMAGTEGDRAASQYVERAFRALGLEVITQSYPVTIPVTKWCRIARIDPAAADPDADGGVSLVPFWPNHVRTCTTGPAGITGLVIDGGDGGFAALEGKQVRGNILLLRMTPDDDWLPAAKLGAAALLFRPSEQPRDYARKFLNFPAHLPRFLAEGPVDELVGRRVRIDARVDWRQRTARNVIGVLRAPQPSTEALIQIAFTDSWSVVPDRAPGYYEACSVTALLASARALAGQRDGLARDAVFVACSGRSLGAIGPRRIIDALGYRDRFDVNHALLERRLAEAERDHDAIERAHAAAGDGGYAALRPGERDALWRRHGADARAALTEVGRRLIDRHIRELSARETTADLEWRDAGRPEQGAARDRHLEVTRRLRRARSAAGADLRSLERSFADVLEQSQCLQRVPGALDEALDHARGRLASHRDALRVADLLGRYDRSIFLVLAPSTHGVRLRYECDGPLARELEAGREAITLAWLARSGRPQRIEQVDRHLFHGNSTSDLWSYTGPNRVFPVEKVHRNIFVQMTRVISYSLHVPLSLTAIDLPEGYQTPLDTRVSHEDLAGQSQLATAVAAHLLAREQPLPLPVGAGWYQKRWFSDIGGRVVTAGDPNAILPTQRVPDALVVLRGMLGRYFHVQKARDGVFRFPAIEVGAGKLHADAFTIDVETGEITGARDMGLEGQRFRNSYYKASQFKQTQTRITILLARMAPTDFYHLVGPATQPVTLRPPLDAALRTPLEQYGIIHDWDHGATVFVRPGRRFYLPLGNYPHYRYYGREIDRQHVFAKGFLTGWSPAADPDAVTAGAGPGYVSGHDRRGIFQEVDAARSAAAINRGRLNRQVAHGLGDPVNLKLAERAERLLDRGIEALDRRQYTRAQRDLNESVALSMRAYPTVRTALVDAVNGILFYMFLCIPFALFGERLLLGSSDIRARIAGTLAIFLLAFLLIRAAHPAYEMIGSPKIVLVGFVIAMLCLLILTFLAARFAERMAALRRAGSGAPDSAASGEGDISRAAAAAAAFTLGINNMRKRKARTGFTVATLVLVSFCLVCFTAPRPQWVERRMVIGPASYDGAVLRFERVAAGHLDAARDRYGDRATVIGRRSVYQAGWACSYLPGHGRLRSSVVHATLLVEPAESRLSGMDRLLRAGRWFKRGDARICYLSDVVAAELGIDPADLERRDGPQVEILLAGWPIEVAGIFDSAALEALRDIDGETMLPEHDGHFNLRARQKQRTRQLVGRPGGAVFGGSHVAASRTILLPLDARQNGLVSSITLLFDDQPHGAVLETIDRMMDSAPTFIGFALDGLSFFGGRFRLVGVETLVDIVAPLLIASLIVLNTMLGSVYERRGEIAVYSAVGLSPRHVLCLFLAESLVYAVIGVVGGYMLALGLAAIGQLTGDAWGLTVNYSSRSAVYVTAAVMISVLLSTLVPARRAARIASPAEHAPTTVPEPTGPGRMDFTLPFTYRGRDALAVAAFMADWFESHGDDASGPFSASPPEVRLAWPGEDAAPPSITVSATIWLRPYDLGVSQDVRIAVTPIEMPQDGGLLGTSVELDRLTGDENTWRRGNRRFIGLLRHHLLRWRSLSPRRKQMLYEHMAGRARDPGES